MQMNHHVSQANVHTHYSGVKAHIRTGNSEDGNAFCSSVLDILRPALLKMS